MPELAAILSTDAEIDAAIRQACILERYDRRVVAASYSSALDALQLRLEHGVTYNIPRSVLQGLRNASVSALSTIEILGNGSGIFWPALDVAHSIQGLLAGVFGSAAWMDQLADEATHRPISA
jgi:hypothetical protein